jgi:HAD superfamily phosphatase (TIGR01668 family)
MFIKPDYNLESIYDINLEELKLLGFNAILFDLDSTLMASGAGFYSAEVLEWIDGVKKNFFVGVVSNNYKPLYVEKVRAASDFPCLFDAKKPEVTLTQQFMEQHGLETQKTVFVGDRPLTDIVTGQKLGCKTILVDSITAKTEHPLIRFVRKLERLSVKN